MMGTWIDLVGMDLVGTDLVETDLVGTRTDLVEMERREFAL